MDHQGHAGDPSSVSQLIPASLEGWKGCLLRPCGSAAVFQDYYRSTASFREATKKMAPHLQQNTGWQTGLVDIVRFDDRVFKPSYGPEPALS